MSFLIMCHNYIITVNIKLFPDLRSMFWSQCGLLKHEQTLLKALEPDLFLCILLISVADPDPDWIRVQGQVFKVFFLPHIEFFFQIHVLMSEKLPVL